MKNYRIIASLLVMLPLGVAAEFKPLPLSQSYWQSEEFLKAFNGSYRTNARIEPYITSAEKVLLQQIQNLMAKGARKPALGAIKASPLSAKSAAIQFNLGSIYFEEGELDMAKAAYQSALKMYPSFRRAHKNLGVVELRLENQEDAMQSLLKAVELGDMSAGTLGLLGYCHLEAENHASALQAYQLAQLTEPSNLSWKAGVAQCLLAMNKLSEGISVIAEVYKQAPAEDGYAQLYVHALMQDEQNEKAIALLELLLRQERLDYSQRALLAQLYAGSGDFRLAKPHLDAVLEEFLKTQGSEETLSVSPLVSVIQSVMVLGEWRFALESLKQVDLDGLELTQKSEIGRLKAYSMAQLGMQEAVPLIDQLLRQNPLDGELILLTAKLNTDLGNLAAAEVFYERAQNLEKFRYNALLAHGALLVEQKRYKAALAKYEAAQKIKATQQQAKYIAELRRVVGLQ